MSYLVSPTSVDILCIYEIRTSLKRGKRIQGCVLYTTQHLPRILVLDEWVCIVWYFQNLCRFSVLGRKIRRIPKMLRPKMMPLLASAPQYNQLIAQTNLSVGVLTVLYQGASKPLAARRRLRVSILDVKYQ